MQKGRSLPEAGKWGAIAQVGLLRLQYQSGQYAKVLAEYKRGQKEIPEEVRAEMMLIVGNSHRQLGQTKEADEMYQQIIAKYPSKEEAKDAQYQRLINFYNTNSPNLLAEIDAYINSNPAAERADQAKLLKAEHFYKEQKFAEAAPIYTELRASQLSPKLRAEAAYKLGWCYVQLKDGPNITDAFDYFVKAFPESPQMASALTQRALAHQADKNYDAALEDLNTLLTKYPAAREREAALQQKALILGQQDNAKGMADTFRQLLKEYPKSLGGGAGPLLHRQSGVRREGLQGSARPSGERAPAQQGAILQPRHAADRLRLLLSERPPGAEQGSGWFRRGQSGGQAPGGDSRMARPGVLQRKELSRSRKNISPCWARAKASEA